MSNASIAYSPEEFKEIILPIMHSLVNSYEHFKPFYIQDLSKLGSLALSPEKPYKTIARNYGQKILTKTMSEMHLPPGIEIDVNLTVDPEQGKVSASWYRVYYCNLNIPRSVFFFSRKSIFDDWNRQRILTRVE